MDFRLSVFVSVAHHLNFTKASKELYISQPAISKNIKELEKEYGVQLFERMGGKIALTIAGTAFLAYAKSILEGYRALRLEMNLLTGNIGGTLHVGASTTIAQYLLPEILARFIFHFPNIRFLMLTGNSEQVEQALVEHRIDVGLVEGNSRHAGFSYSHFAKDELVMVTNAHNKIKGKISLKELSVLPLVLRESGSGTLEVIENRLAEQGWKLSEMNVLLQLGSTEGIKSFLENCRSAYAFVSIAAVTHELMENRLRVIEVESITLEREFALVTLQGAQNELVEKFIQFLLNK